MPRSGRLITPGFYNNPGKILQAAGTARPAPLLCADLFWKPAVNRHEFRFFA
jgi:hypothetical protein